MKKTILFIKVLFIATFLFLFVIGGSIWMLKYFDLFKFTDEYKSKLMKIKEVNYDIRGSSMFVTIRGLVDTTIKETDILSQEELILLNEELASKVSFDSIKYNTDWTRYNIFINVANVSKSKQIYYIPPSRKCCEVLAEIKKKGTTMACILFFPTLILGILYLIIRLNTRREI